MRTKVQDYFIKFLDQVSERKFLLYWFSNVINYPEVNETFKSELNEGEAPSDIKIMSDKATTHFTMEVKFNRFYPVLPGEIYQKVLGNDKHLYVVTESSDTKVILEYLGTNLETPLIKLNNNIDIYAGEIKNFKGEDNGRGKTEMLVTSPGMLLLNQRLFVESFGDVVPYKNDEIKVGYLDDLLANLLFEDKITVEQAQNFLTNAYDIGFFAELNNRGFTEKSFTTHPDIPKRKKELLSKLTPEQKKDPLVLANIEDELLKMDREYLAGDDADLFHSAVGSKSYDIHRKKLMIMVGAIPAFSDKGDVEFDLIENSLAEGMDKNNFDVYVNEVYKGSYSRGAETAKGGELTKYVLRVYQDLSVKELDCGSKEYMTIELVNDQKSKANSKLLGRTLPNGGVCDMTYLTSNLGKTIQIRDPLYCKSKNGICYKCMGNNFERVGEVDIGSYILDISSGIMMISMKNMHGTKLTTFDINFKDYLITL